MQIKLDERYQLVSDELQFTLQEIKVVQEEKNKGKEYAVSIGFYSKIEDALVGYTRHKLLDSKATTLHELIEEVRALKQYIKDLVNGV